MTADLHAGALWRLAERVEADEVLDLRATLANVLDICPAWQGRQTFDLSNLEKVDRLIALDAVECAVLTLIPTSVDLTGGMYYGRSTFVAQAIISPTSRSHALQAHSLAAGWLAAYLRALAIDMGYSMPADEAALIDRA